jgi:acetate kinase
MILTINAGSSSLKFAVFGPDAVTGRREVAGELQRIGFDDGFMSARDSVGRELVSRRALVANHATALGLLLDWLSEAGWSRSLVAVSHRLVHGGREFRDPVMVTPAILARIASLVPLAPNHLPVEIAAVDAVAARVPALPQVACFDTTFHRHLPSVARLLGLPRDVAAKGVVRYGFHGLSYEFIVDELRRQAGDAAARGRLVAAHLGSGASVCAIRDGQSVDTSMGFTPTGGLVMATRSGDLDPGALLYLLEQDGQSAADLADMVDRRSGLLGISGRSSDMRDLLGDDRAEAREAVDLFCYRVRKEVGAYAAALGGIDTLVFTGGIGENLPEIRVRICDGLAFLGIDLVAEANRCGADIISRPEAAVAVRVIRTDEERMLAAHAASLIARRDPEKE